MTATDATGVSTIRSELAQNWWAVALRGALGILFGLIAFFQPGATMLSLALVFAAHAFVDGILAIAPSVRAIRQEERWGYLMLEGVIDGAGNILPLKSTVPMRNQPLITWGADRRQLMPPCGR